ncbi:Tll0287-like domain-containing protein [Sulfurimonas paralvinellae]|uniref:DUF3365 domain-containing protein n=1 Tax=Sulfurimonas paralvinellae TaxID=317658 RepID=A0A7M1B8R7_9BACT|nr:DUF3365 domain-containing protein [Sulfurimonas paralvinellae]QOP46011.1 DUF3365 domain-containing protein [Sulfurimonas paralvinellae]
MKILKVMTLVGLTASLLAAAPQKNRDAKFKEIVKTGQKSSKMLMQTLGKNMKKNMKAGGPIKALDFCSKEAYNLTEKVNTKLPKGVNVKRISMKFRNPANEPQGNEANVLEALAKLKNANVVLPKHLIEKVDEHTYKYYKPIIINKQVCLKCHGDVKDTDLKRAIQTNYPIDKAMGYKMGDLRGAVVVTIKK